MTDQQTRPNTVPGGQVDEPGASALQEGDFGLDGDLRTQMLQALEGRWNADDPGATTIENDDADTAATPGPDPATPSTPAAPAQVDDGAGEGGVGGEGAAPVDPPPADPGTTPSPSPSPEDTQFSLDQYAEQYFGTRLNPAQARELFAVLGGLQNLTPEQRAQVDQIVAGGAPNQYPVTQGQPVAQPQHPVTSAGPPATPTQTPPSPYSSLPPRPDDEYEAQLYDKYIAPLANTTQAQLAEIQASIAATTRAQQQADQERAAAVIESASTSWRAQYPVITDGEYDALVDRITRSGTFPSIIQAHRGDIAAATNAILEQHFWSDPALRSKAIANIASGRAVGDPATLDPASPIAQQAADADNQRQARASSLAGGGGSTTPRGNAPQPKDSAGRKQALIAEIAAQGDFS